MQWKKSPSEVSFIHWENSSIDLPAISEIRFGRDLYNVKIAKVESRIEKCVQSKIRPS